MLGIDQRVARYTWTAAAVVLSLVLVYLLRRTLFIFIVALLFAYLLSPLVNFLDRFLPGRTRTAALAMAYIIFVGAVVLLGSQIGSLVAKQASDFAHQFPAMLAKWEAPAPEATPEMNSLKAQIVEKVRQQLYESSSSIIAAAASAGLKFVTLAGDVLFVVIVPILAFFFLKDGRQIRDHMVDLVDEGPRRMLLEDLMADIHLLLAHYMRALVVLSAAAFIAYATAFSIMGVPYAVLLAAVGGLLEFIPLLGPFTAGVMIVIVGAVAGFNVLPMIIFLLAYRVFQDYMLSPHLMGQGVELHPLLVLFGVFAGAEVAGIGGTFLSVPVLAMVRIVYVRIRKSRMAARLQPGPVTVESPL
ncbi:MAG TPA: AI-2E family transporter [Bryobacteraceae bacterium]|nr:AI-2E family transporter [Bryobacteraceae bacterium]